MDADSLSNDSLDSSTRSTSLGMAIVGTGSVADFHVMAIDHTPNAHLAAIVHYDPAQFADLAARFGVPCLSFSEALEHPDIQAFSLCTPSGLHAEQTIAAANAGKHVLVEKPMALNPTDADAMIAACDHAGVTLAVMLQRRGEVLFQTVKQAIAAGDVGRLRLGLISMPYFRAEAYYQQAAWRGSWQLDGGGVLMNQGIHLLDLLLWYFGDPVQVQASAAALERPIEVEDTLAGVLEFASGARATVTATTTAAPGFAHRLELYGDKGGIQIEGEQVRRWTLTQQGHVEPISGVSAAVNAGVNDDDAGAGADPRGIAATGHIALMQDFVSSIFQHRTPLVSGHEGKRSVQTVWDIYRAAGLR
jgi:predicted dehydrogenase